MGIPREGKRKKGNGKMGNLAIVFSNYYRAERGLAMRILSVCPSVRLSVKRVNCDKTEKINPDF